MVPSQHTVITSLPALKLILKDHPINQLTITFDDTQPDTQTWLHELSQQCSSLTSLDIHYYNTEKTAQLLSTLERFSCLTRLCLRGNMGVTHMHAHTHFVQLLSHVTTLRELHMDRISFPLRAHAEVAHNSLLHTFTCAHTDIKQRNLLAVSILLQ